MTKYVKYTCELFAKYLKDICIKSASTIYVTSRGAWKLGGLEHAGDDIENDVDTIDIHIDINDIKYFH